MKSVRRFFASIVFLVVSVVLMLGCTTATTHESTTSVIDNQEIQNESDPPAVRLAWMCVFSRISDKDNELIGMFFESPQIQEEAVSGCTSMDRASESYKQCLSIIDAVTRGALNRIYCQAAIQVIEAELIRVYSIDATAE